MVQPRAACPFICVVLESRWKRKVVTVNNEQIHLSRKERSVLKKSIYGLVPLEHCDTLIRFGLVEQDIEHIPGYRGKPLDTCHITDRGRDFLAYYRDMRRDIWLKNVWIPIIVSFVTTVSTNYIIPKLPMLTEWFRHIFSRTVS